MKKQDSVNPFDQLATSGTRHIEVKALGGASVEIKTSLTIAEEQKVKRTTFSNQETVGMNIFPNQADAFLGKVQVVSFVLVSPKMSMTELGELNGGEDAINEIYDAFEKGREEKKGN